jgi:D-alanine-D-alanine ligase
MHVLLLAGGYSNERDVSIRSGDAVQRALTTNGHKVRRIDPKEDVNWEQVIKDIDVAFIALHGAGGEDGVIQAQLEKMNISYTGSGIGASDLCWDKWAYKEFLHDKNIPLSPGALVSINNLENDYFKKPFVLKPIRGGSTIDMLIVREVTPKKLHEAKKLLRRYDFMLIEELITGTEITVPVVGNTALDIIEIIPPENKDFDYENKYNGQTQELCPPQNVSVEIQAKAKELAIRIHTITGCRDLSRTDMMIDTRNNLYVLETNTGPGLTDTSLLPKSAAVAGMDMPALCDTLIHLALKH